ncbi:MAG: cyclodeaminase/cyclohydrolase family protein [Actinobacteria bacterium]|nr:cyclodeaminase/cyclohydrolase family protein [Actinomycetota bacterium]
MRDETIGSFLERLAARVPVPGGGATAALHAAQGAALLEMTARFSDGARNADHADTIQMIIAESDRLREACVDLVAIDGEAFGAVAEAFALPKDTDEQRAARSAAIGAAMVTASSPPAELIGVGSRVLELAELLQPIVNRTVAGDVAAAVQAIRAAVATCRVNIEANLTSVTDQGARERLAAVVAVVDELEQRADRLTAAIRVSFEA